MEDDSLFTNLIQFDKKLLKEMKTDNIDTLDQLMDMVPQFCENLRFRKVVWEEIHTLSPLRRVRAHLQGKMNRNNTMLAQGENSPRDYANLVDIPQTAYQASKQTPYTGSKASNTQSINDSPMDFDELKKTTTHKTIAPGFRKRMSIDPSKAKNMKFGHLESAPGILNSP